MKKWIVIIALVIFTLLGIGIYYYLTQNSSNNGNYEAERTATNTNQSPESQAPENDQNQNQAVESQQPEPQPAEAQQAEAQQAAQTPIEAEEISSFSTKIYTKDSSRQNNITITCSTLNDTDVENGETFSFCNTVGRASPSKGYEEADIFSNGKKTKGYGGGNCQVSTTLYNAVLAVPSLTVTERHEHSKKVPYIQNGKDAAVAYGTYDFKFVNNTGSTIRIKANHTAEEVSISLIRLQ